MDQIFQDYHDMILTGDEFLKEIYGTYQDVPLKWIECEHITIKSLVNRICDDFESNGFDLDELPLDNIREKFIECEPVVRVPPEYTQLVAAKNQAKEQLEAIKADENLKAIDSYDKIVGHIETMIASIDNKLQELV